MVKLAFVILVFISCTSCLEWFVSIPPYKKNDVKILSVLPLSENKTRIEFHIQSTPILEFSGVNTWIDENNRTKLKFIPCYFENDCKVDIDYEYLEGFISKIVVDAPPDAIDLVFEDGVFKLSN